MNIDLALDKRVSEMLDVFTELARIPALSKAERPITDWLRLKFAHTGFTFLEDNAGEKIGGNSGNILIFPPQYKSEKKALVLSAHMDTARSTQGLQIIQHEDRITSDGTTQLGVDNRAGLSILTYMMLHQQELGINHTNYFCVFTVAEEIGLYGAYELDLSPYKVEGIYVFDSAMRPGNYIAECAGLYLFDVEIVGKAAHSAVAPEKGISAIEVAAQAIAQLKFGRLDDFVTTNIGIIRGGDATNVIALSCVLEGEVRALNIDQIQTYLDLYERAFHDIANEFGAQIKFESRKDFNPYLIDTEHPLRKHLESAIKAVQLVPNPIRYTGGSDANVYNEKGIPAINLGIGAQNPHGNDEFMLYDDFKSVLELAVSLLQQQ